MTRFVHIASRSLVLALVVATVQPVFAAEPPATTSAASRTTAQKLAFAEAAVAEVDAATQSMEDTLAQARDKGDTEGVKWLVPRVTAAQALQRVVQQSFSSMQEAADSGQDAKVDHEYRKITVAMSKAKLLLAETERFKQGDAAAPGSTSLEWQEQLVLADPFEEVVIDDLDVSVDPPQVSPFL